MLDSFCESAEEGRENEFPERGGDNAWDDDGGDRVRDSGAGERPRTVPCVTVLSETGADTERRGKMIGDLATWGTGRMAAA